MDRMWLFNEPPPDITVTTPGTRLIWSNLYEWLEAYYSLDARKSSGAKYIKTAAHVAALPLDHIKECASYDVLIDSRSALYCEQPPRGIREFWPGTRLIVEINNQIGRIFGQEYMKKGTV